MLCRFIRNANNAPSDAEYQAARNPAAQVTDRASEIRITGLRTWWVNPVVFVRIETNRGVAGWGDIKGVDPRPARALAHSLFELLDGENPTRIEYLWQKLYRAHRDIRGGPFMVHTIAGLDMALWDIKGKALGVPVWQLLGGRVRDSVRVYTHMQRGAIDKRVRTADISAFCDAVQETIEMGYNAVKLAFVPYTGYDAPLPAVRHVEKLAAAVR